MSRYPLDSRFWADKGVARLDVGAKLLAIYALTGAQTNRIGYFVFDVVEAARQLGMAVDEEFQRVRTELLWKYDESSRVLLIPAWWRYHNPGSPKALAGYASDFRVLPPNSLVDDFARVSRQLLGMRWPAFAEACGITIEAPPGEQQEFFALDAHQQLTAYFVEAWEREHPGANYCHTRAQDGKAVKRLLEHLKGDLEKAKRFVDMYFEDPDEYRKKNGSTLSLLCQASRLTKYSAALAGGGRSAFDREWEKATDD